MAEDDWAKDMDDQVKDNWDEDDRTEDKDEDKRAKDKDKEEWTNG